MRVLVLDGTWNADALAMVLKNEGHKVFCTTDNHATARFATNLGYRQDYGNALSYKWDLVIGPGSEVQRDGTVDKFRAKGFPTIGAGSKGLVLEEKWLARQLFEQAGLTNPVYVACDSRNLALESLVLFDGGIAVKFDDTARIVRTFLCHDRDEAAYVLSTEPEGPVVLEEMIDGIEVDMTVYFDGRSFVPSVTKFEYKHLFPNGIGPITSQMGSFQFYDPTPRWIETFKAIFSTPIAQEFLQDYRGPLSIGFFLSKGQLIPIEFTCRCGGPDFAVTTALMQDSFGEYLLSVANGDAWSASNLLCHSDDYVAAAVVAVCGFTTHEYDSRILHLGSKVRCGSLDERNILFNAIDCDMRTSGARVAVVLGLDSDPAGAIDTLYRNVDRVKFQEMIYRPDIGADFFTVREELHRAGLLTTERLR